MEVTREVVLEAPVDEVWDALTDPERLEEWFTEDGEERRARRRGGRDRRRFAIHVGGGPRRDRGRGGRRRHACRRHRDRRARLERASRCAPSRTPTRDRRLRRARRSDAAPHRRVALPGRGLGDAARGRAAGDAPGGREAPDRAAEAGLVESRRQGRETLYRVNPEPLDAAAAWIVRVGGEWDARLGAAARPRRARAS